MRKGEGPYREGGESCASCIELARENGELRAANSKFSRAKVKRTAVAWGQVICGSAMVGAMVSATLSATAWIHGCASRLEVESASPCVEKAELIRITDLNPVVVCHKDAKASFDKLEGSDVLVRCTCATAAAERPR